MRSLATTTCSDILALIDACLAEYERAAVRQPPDQDGDGT